MLPTLHIKLLGDFSLAYSDAPVISVNTARLQSLLAYLVLHRNAPQSRQHLAFLLWPDSTEGQARTNLRREFHHLRHSIPDADRFLCTDARMLQWCPGTSYTLDVAEFEDALAAADRAEAGRDSRAARERLEAAAAIYRGDLLPGCYDEWLLAERDRLRQQYTTALERLARLLEDQREYATAIRYARHLLRLDPLHEVAYCGLMRLHTLNNDRASALRVYHTCVTVLQRELGVEPSPATRAVYERVLSADTPSQPETVPRPRLATRLPLIGRQREWDAFQAAWRTATGGQTHCVCVVGEAGIGKTRLAEELLYWASQQGIATAKTRCYAGEGHLAYAPVTEWLRSDILRAARARTAPVWLTEVARLLPELLVERPDLPPPEPLTESWQRLRLFEALARAVLAASQPLLLAIDDLQWCDQETLEWLRYLLHFDSAAQLLVIGTVRTEEVGVEHPLHSLLIDLRSAEQMTDIALRPLDAGQTAALAAQVAGRELDADVAAHLYQETEGNPLFVVETLRAELSASVGEQWSGVRSSLTPRSLRSAVSLSPRVHAVITARLAQLSAPARELASLAATIGRAFTLDVLAQACDSDEDSMVRGLDELWRQHIVREQGADAYDFSHDKIREVAYGALSTAHRRLLHRRVALALERAHASDLDAVSGQVAAHYEQAGLGAQAIPYYQRAAVAAQRVYANEEAISLLNRALALLPTLPENPERDARELAMQVALGVSVVATRGYAAAEVLDIYGRARYLCQSLGRPPSAPILRALAIVHISRAEFEQAHDLGDQLLGLTEEDQDLVLLVEAHYVLGVTLFWQGAFAASRSHLEQAIAHYSPEQSRIHIALYSQDPKVICLSRLAFDLWCLGYPHQATRIGQETLALAHELAHPLSLGYAMYWAALLQSCCRAPRETQEQAEALIALCRDRQVGFWRQQAVVLQGWACLEQEDVEAGLAQMHEGMAVSLTTGIAFLRPYYLALMAEQYAKREAVEHGLALVAEALAAVDQSGERWCAAELLRIQGELLLRRGADAEAEAAFVRAITTARAQDAKSLELRAATSLARLWQRQARHSEARNLLAGIYGWFTEGFDTADLQEARALLEAVS